MQSPHEHVIEDLLVSVNRLIRVAAQASGNATTAAAWRTLGILQTDAPLRLGELARASRVSQPTMTKLVRGMVDDGLVTRAVDPLDSRSQLLDITDAGRDRLLAWRATMAATVIPLLGELDDTDWNTLEQAASLLATRIRTEATA
jgi:DNA-binding MarR family transcriptional regulator